MTVAQLIQLLETFNPHAKVVTNACEATYTHEDIHDDVYATVQKDGDVFVGSRWPYCTGGK